MIDEFQIPNPKFLIFCDGVQPHRRSNAASLPYRAIIAVIDAARGAGVDRVGIVTEAMKRQR